MEVARSHHQANSEGDDWRDGEGSKRAKEPTCSLCTADANDKKEIDDERRGHNDNLTNLHKKVRIASLI